MLLLMLIGYAPPIIPGVRAYGRTTVRAVTGGATGVTTVTRNNTALTARTTAHTTEE